MTPSFELSLGRLLLAVNIADPAETGPRLARGRYGDNSWWIELRLFGRILGAYR